MKGLSAIVLLVITLHKPAVLGQLSVPKPSTSRNHSPLSARNYDSFSGHFFQPSTRYETFKQENIISPPLQFRGGAAAALLSKFEEYVSASRMKCWMLLSASILIETLATTGMKLAHDEKSLAKSSLSYVAFFLR